MLKRAVDSHQANSKQQKTLAQALFPSSSPVQATPSRQTTLPVPTNARPQNSSINNILRPSSSAALNTSLPRNPSTNTVSGIKRTSSGLEKVLGRAGSFEENAPVKSSVPQVTQSEYFDADDFSSDVELDIEDPSTRGSVTYPSIPTKATSTINPVFYPTLPRQQSHDVQSRRTSPDDSGYGSIENTAFDQPPESSAPLSWPSSPPEHRAPVQKDSLGRFVYSGVPTDRQHTNKAASVAAQSLAASAAARPTKRRTLPWLEQDKQMIANGPPLPQSTRSPPSKIKSESLAYTPLPKDSKKSAYPWNTTASAIKDQQKQLREVNKKKVKNNEGSAETILKAKSTKSKNHVARVFLSEEQQHVLDLVAEHKKSVFFTGSAGTGKSVLLREIIATLRKKFTREPDRVAVTASTGLAACNIGGVTLHSFAGIGLGKEDVPELVKKIKRNQKAKHRWMRTKILVVDEISMVDGELFDKLEAIARQLRNNGRPFGGIQLVITGDFFQLPPVPDYGKVSKFAFDAASWTTSIEHTIGLHHVFRQKDPVFAGMLNEMREGRLTQSSINAFRALDRPMSNDNELEATELFPTRAEVERANTTRMGQLVGETRTYEARDGGTITDKAQRDKLLLNCMAPENVTLKKGAQVMLIKNIDESLVNGSLGKVIGFMSEQTFDAYHEDEETFLATQGGTIADDGDVKDPKLKAKQRIMDNLLGSTTQTWPVVRFSIADGTTRDLLCQRENWKVELPNGEVQASRAQVPLILAWALSIHKAQGQTLERVKVDLGKVFEKGQAYVALSRATSMNGLQVLRFDPRKVVAHEKVRTFYQNLSRVEVLEREKGGTGKVVKMKGKAEEYERRFVDGEL